MINTVPFTTLANHIKDLVICLSSDGYILMVNPTLENFLGVSRNDIIGEKFLEIFPNLNIDILTTINIKDLKNHLPIIDLEYSCKDHAGLDCDILWSLLSLPNVNNPDGLMLVGRNITELKKLAIQVERLDNIIKYAPDMIYWKDRNSIHLGCNNQFAIAAGYPNRDAIIGKSDYDFPWREQAAKYNRDDREVIESEEPRLNIEDIMPFKSGKQAVVITNKVPLRDYQTGQVIGVLGIATDITELKEVEKQFKKAKEKAELANKATRIFAESMAHELRTPLGSINGYIYGIKKYLPTLLKGYQLAEKNNLPVAKIRRNHYKSLTKILKNTESEIRHANSVVDMILFRANSNKLKKSSFKIHSIKSCIKKALTYYPFKNLEQAILVNWNLEKDFKFKGDKLFTIHIIFNLLKNALYYIEKERKGEIFIWTSSELNYNLIHFKDTSKGISPAILPKIFDLYFSNTPHGTGVGLAFCKQVMEIFSGTIECYSEEGVYTEFILKFPILNKEN